MGSGLNNDHLKLTQDVADDKKYHKNEDISYLTLPIHNRSCKITSGMCRIQVRYWSRQKNIENA